MKPPPGRGGAPQPQARQTVWEMFVFKSDIPQLMLLSCNLTCPLLEPMITGVTQVGIITCLATGLTSAYSVQYCVSETHVHISHPHDIKRRACIDGPRTALPHISMCKDASVTF